MTRISSSALLSLAGAAGLLATFSVPAAADPVPGAAQPTAAAAADGADDRRRYCVNNTTSGADTVTGSMLSRRTCRTRAEWARLGVEIPRR